MSDGTAAINPGTGILIDTDELTVGSNVVQRQRIRVAGSAAAELAAVKNSVPSSTDYGVVVRQPGPTGQDYGTIACLEFNAGYFASRSRSNMSQARIENAAVTNATGVQLAAAVASKINWVVYMDITSDTTINFALKTDTIAGANGYWGRLIANTPRVLTAPAAGWIAGSSSSQALWFFVSANATINATFMLMQA